MRCAPRTPQETALTHRPQLYPVTWTLPCHPSIYSASTVIPQMHRNHARSRRQTPIHRHWPRFKWELALPHFSCAHSTTARAPKAPLKGSTGQASNLSVWLMVSSDNEALEVPHISSNPWQSLNAPAPGAAATKAARRLFRYPALGPYCSPSLAHMLRAPPCTSHSAIPL